MKELIGYPLSIFVSALRTVVGRVLLAFGAAALGAFLGGLTATTTCAGGCWAVSEFIMMAVSSMFTSAAIIALPATLIFICVFARFEWPLWTVLVATALIWWYTHASVSWLINDSPAAQMQRILEKAEREAEEATQKAKQRGTTPDRKTP
ncbi:MAG: hypothetical protein HZA88_18920 [Verrucomicrobia bacterium]|nr:hypothetical protein [Verrucomicrobiota bacterium]